MMSFKVFCTLVLLAVCASIINAQKPSAIMLPALDADYTNLYNTAKLCFATIRQSLGMSNAMHGDPKEMDALTRPVEANVDNIAVKIHGNVPNIDKKQAFAYLDQLQPTFTGLQAKLQKYINKLPPQQKGTVTNHFTKCHKDCSEIGNRIRRLYN